MEPREREIRLGGLRFHYVEWGAAGASPLVLLHGVTSHARTWDDFAASMADRFRALALDQRGHGDSDRA
ncbi:MAG: alpha/beta fold hydrolase, partial [Candidatus Rokubacteria bacterium]|nr:alpha/beta fold hydrolase [Candidatus Rokubacteria bacterium]